MASSKEKLDAGLASLDHYKYRLPTWRYTIRQWLLPIVRIETPYVAWLQEYMRSPALDTYFAMSANLGTHTCFMVVLPMLYWCGSPFLGNALVTILAAGVFFSGFVKDMLCLPRPLSPPLTRITMSGSAALEYGFPSTHSTNAVSVAVFSVLLLRDGSSTFSAQTNLYLQILAYLYATSIVLGRLYCGMHGFFDVVSGSLLGAAIAVAQYKLGPIEDQYFYTGDVKALAILLLIVLVLVRIHPEPADDCPCFDDSVAFSGTVLGCKIGCWHFARTIYADPNATHPAAVPFSVVGLGWSTVIARVLVGVVVVFLWRASMKPFLLKSLPPIFRVVEDLGLDLPRRFFKPASQYKTVPVRRDDDNVIPSARDIPKFLSNLRRRRAISVGPQSEADAYEALAYRQKRRRDSLKSQGGQTPLTTIQDDGKKDYFGADKTANHSRKRSLSLEEFRAQMGSGAILSPAVVSPMTDISPAQTAAEYEKDRSELFATVRKPRVRYDVEVVTKLIVYFGIGWWAVEGNPILFYHLGLGTLG